MGLHILCDSFFVTQNQAELGQIGNVLGLSVAQMLLNTAVLALVAFSFLTSTSQCHHHS